MGVRSLASISAASAWVIRVRVVQVVGPKWLALVQGVANYYNAENAALLGMWLRMANSACSTLSSSDHIPEGMGRGERDGVRVARAATATSGVAG